MRAVDAAEALDELTQISDQIKAVAIADERGDIVGTTAAGGDVLVSVARALMEQAATVEEREPVQIGVSTAQGSVFVVRDRALTIVATTRPEPIVGLVLYDLKNCLGALEQPKPKRRRTRKAPDA